MRGHFLEDNLMTQAKCPDASEHGWQELRIRTGWGEKHLPYVRTAAIKIQLLTAFIK